MSRANHDHTAMLRIDASARGIGSLTRRLAEHFLELWRAEEPKLQLEVRDVGQRPPPPIDEAWIAAAFATGRRTDAQRQHLALSDELIDEVRRAHVVVIAPPMYNYGMPAALKAWFDQVIRIGETFTFDLARGDRPILPKLTNKALVVLSSSGEFGFGPGELNAAHGHLIPHIRSCARYLGADSTDVVAIEYQEFRDARHEASKERAFEALPQLVRRVRTRVSS